MLINLNFHIFNIQKLRFESQAPRSAHEPLFIILCFDAFLRIAILILMGLEGPEKYCGFNFVPGHDLKDTYIQHSQKHAKCVLAILSINPLQHFFA